MKNLSVEEEVRLLALPVADDAACPTLDLTTAAAITRNYLQRRSRIEESDETIYRMWEGARALVFSSTSINATILELVLDGLEGGGGTSVLSTTPQQAPSVPNDPSAE